VVGLGEAEAADNLSLGESGQVLFLELVASERVCCGRFLTGQFLKETASRQKRDQVDATDGVHDERALDAHGGPVARVDPLDFARDEAVRDARYARAAVPLDRRSEQAEFSHLGQDLAVKVWRRTRSAVRSFTHVVGGLEGLTFVTVRFDYAGSEVLLAVRLCHVPVVPSSIRGQSRRSGDRGKPAISRRTGSTLPPRTRGCGP
jgi:hypothetical protein